MLARHRGPAWSEGEVTFAVLPAHRRTLLGSLAGVHAMSPWILLSVADGPMFFVVQPLETVTTGVFGYGLVREVLRRRREPAP